MNERVWFLAEKCPFFGATEEYDEIKNADDDPEFLSNHLEAIASFYKEALHCFEVIDTGVSEAIIRSGLYLTASHFLSAKNKPWLEILFKEINELENDDEDFIQGFIIGFVGVMLKTYKQMIDKGVTIDVIQEISLLSRELCEEIACAKPVDAQIKTSEL